MLGWLRPYLGGHEKTLKNAGQSEIVQAMRRDKKNDGEGLTFILTRGPGRMEKRSIPAGQARDLLTDVIAFF